MEYKNYKLIDKADFYDYCIKCNRKEQTTILGENLVDGKKNGAFIEMDMNKSSSIISFYNNNNYIGPMLRKIGKNFEYSYSNGKYPFNGFRIKYSKGTFYFAYYDEKGLLTGKGFEIHDDGKVFFTSLTEFEKVNKQQFSTISFNKFHNKKLDALPGIPLNPEGELYHVPVYYKGTNDVHSIKAIGGMYSKHKNFDSREFDGSYDNFRNQLSNLNNEYKKGLGYYPYSNGDLGIGHITRGTTFKNVGFSGECIFIRKDGTYELGGFLDDRKSGIVLMCDNKKSVYEIAYFLDNARYGFSIRISLDGLILRHYINNESKEIMYVDNALNLKIQKEDGKTISASYPFTGVENDVKEEVIDNKEREKKEANNSAWDKISNKYSLFNCTIRYVNENNGKVNPLVTIENLKHSVKNLVIPEEVESIGSRFMNATSFGIETINIKSKRLIRINGFLNHSKIRSIYIPQNVRYIDNFAFNSCEHLREAHIYIHTKVESNSFSSKCAIFYYGALTKEEKNLEKQKNEIAKKKLKENKNHFNNKDLQYEELKKKNNPNYQKKSKSELKKLSNGNSKNSSTRELKKEIRKTQKSTKKLRTRNNGKSFNFEDTIKKIFKGIGSFFVGVLNVLLFIPRKIVEYISGGERIVLPYVLCTFSLLVGILTLILGFCGALPYIEDFFSDLVSNHIPSLWGFRLVNLYHSAVTSLKEGGLNQVLSILLSLFYAVIAVFEFTLNVVVAILVLIGFIFFIIYTFGFVFGLGILLIGLSVFSLIISEEKIYPLITLIISIIITILYYIFMYWFYFA